MTIRMLPSGYWHVRWAEYHHAYAQWPRGRECAPEDVSIGEQSIAGLRERLAVAANARCREAT